MQSVFFYIYCVLWKNTQKKQQTNTNLWKNLPPKQVLWLFYFYSSKLAKNAKFVDLKKNFFCSFSYLVYFINIWKNKQIKTLVCIVFLGFLYPVKHQPNSLPDFSSAQNPHPLILLPDIKKKNNCAVHSHQLIIVNNFSFWSTCV